MLSVFAVSRAAAAAMLLASSSSFRMIGNSYDGSFAAPAGNYSGVSGLKLTVKMTPAPALEGTSIEQWVLESISGHVNRLMADDERLSKKEGQRQALQDHGENGFLPFKSSDVNGLMDEKDDFASTDDLIKRVQLRNNLLRPSTNTIQHPAISESDTIQQTLEDMVQAGLGKTAEGGELILENMVYNDRESFLNAHKLGEVQLVVDLTKVKVAMVRWAALQDSKKELQSAYGGEVDLRSCLDSGNNLNPTDPGQVVKMMKSLFFESVADGKAFGTSTQAQPIGVTAITTMSNIIGTYVKKYCSSTKHSECTNVEDDLINQLVDAYPGDTSLNDAWYSGEVKVLVDLVLLRKFSSIKAGKSALHKIYSGKSDMGLRKAIATGEVKILVDIMGTGVFTDISAGRESLDQAYGSGIRAALASGGVNHGVGLLMSHPKEFTSVADGKVFYESCGLNQGLRKYIFDLVRRFRNRNAFYSDLSWSNGDGLLRRVKFNEKMVESADKILSEKMKEMNLMKPTSADRGATQLIKDLPDLTSYK